MASISAPLRGLQPLRSSQAYPSRTPSVARDGSRPAARRSARQPAAAAAKAQRQQPQSSQGPDQAGAAVRGYDFLVLGSGIAGLSYALKAAEHGTVAVITKADAAEGSTRWAQGGICAVLDAADSPESHVYDTIVAGDFESDRRCAGPFPAGCTTGSLPACLSPCLIYGECEPTCPS